MPARPGARFSHCARTPASPLAALQMLQQTLGQQTALMARLIEGVGKGGGGGSGGMLSVPLPPLQGLLSPVARVTHPSPRARLPASPRLRIREPRPSLRGAGGSLAATRSSESRKKRVICRNVVLGTERTMPET